MRVNIRAFRILAALAAVAPAPDRLRAQDPPPARAYQNPLPVVAADPFVYREGDTYYLYATAARDGLFVWTSKDLVHWENRGHAFRRDATTWSQYRFWAPELFKHRGKYYLHFTAGHGRDPEKYKPRIVLSEGDSPLGPFREVKGKAPWFDADIPTLDSHVFRDDDGKLYVYAARLDQPPDKHFEIHVRTLDEDLAPSPETKEVLRPTQPWEAMRFSARDALVAEAPFVLRRGGTYFLTWSGNPQFAPNYGVGVATAKSPTGPWEKSPDNPVLRQTDRVAAPGHHCFIDSPDGRQWFIVYHVRDPGDITADRRLAVDRVEFVDGDRPTIKVLGPTHTPQPLPLARQR